MSEAQVILDTYGNCDAQRSAAWMLCESSEDDIYLFEDGSRLEFDGDSMEMKLLEKDDEIQPGSEEL